MNCFVVYTSKTGMTGKIARELSRKFSADMLKVEPKEPYGGFVASAARVAREKARNEQSASGTPSRDFSEYDVVFVHHLNMSRTGTSNTTPESRNHTANSVRRMLNTWPMM